jgi:beta-glucosidase
MPSIKHAGRTLLAFTLTLSVAHGFSFAQSQTIPSVESRIDLLLEKLTIEQKIDLVGGVSTWYTHAEPSIGLRSLRLSDGPAGLRSGLPATAYPAPIALAATWDTTLARRMGASLGRDARVRGVDLLLGPGVNIARAPVSGRNFEYMGEDPWLASRIAVDYIRGVQSQGVGATVKHFMLNNQEFNRHNASSDADERTKREIYLPAFEAAVSEGHVAAIMDSYNLVDGVHATENGRMNLQIAKKDWGFDGFIVSDWDSVYDGPAAARNGLDLEMPFARFMSPETLLPAIRSGGVTVAMIDDKVRRILRFALRYDLMDRTEDVGEGLFSEASDAVALDVARKSIVLLKNEGGILPLAAASICTLAIIGPNASPAVMGGGGSAIVDTYKALSILQGVADYQAAHSVDTPTCKHKVLYDSGWPANHDVFSQSLFAGGLRQQIYATRDWTGASDDSVRTILDEDRIVTLPTGSIRWEGRFTAPKAGQYFVIVHDGRAADRHTVYVDGQSLTSRSTDLHGELYFLPVPHELAAGQTISIRMDYLPADTQVYPGLGVLSADQILSGRARAIAARADAVVVAVGFDKSTEHEGSDRTFGLPPLQDAMIRSVAGLNRRTIVTLNAGGNVDMRSWLDRVPALLHLWYGGQEAGEALAEVLFGQQNPEGHLPVTFETRWEDNPAFHNYYPPTGAGGEVPHIKYQEGVFLGYRYYVSPLQNTRQIEPRFPFGFGLSYTTFSFSDMRIAKAATADDSVTVTVVVTNTGHLAGAALAQLYVGERKPSVPRPSYELKGFQKVFLKPGESRTASFALDRRSFAYWAEGDNSWRVNPGGYTLLVGDSSEHLALRRDITLP